jgi:hypothetical protein
MVLPAVSFTGGVTIPSATIAFSATPTFNAATVSKFYISLTGNVTSSTLTGSVKDQLVIFVISQDGVGGRTFAWPTNVKGQSIASGAGQTSTQAFTSDGTNLWPIGEMTVSSGTTDVRGNNATLTGQLLAADGSAANPSIGFAGVSGLGFRRFPASGDIVMDASGLNQILWATNLARHGSGMAICLSSNADPTLATGDTCWTRAAAGVWQAGTSESSPNAAGEADARTIGVTGATSGKTSVVTDATASGTATLKAGTYNIVGDSLTQTLPFKTLASPAFTGTETGMSITSPAISSPTITGTAVFNRLRANQGSALVVGDVGSITNFGNTASVSSVTGTDSAGTINISSSGTGQIANGQFILTFHDGTWTTPPICVVTRSDGNGPNSAPAANTASATTLTVIFSGAAVAGTTYGFNFICEGKP